MKREWRGAGEGSRSSKSGTADPYLELGLDDGAESGLVGVQPCVPASERTCVLPTVGLSWNGASMDGAGLRPQEAGRADEGGV